MEEHTKENMKAVLFHAHGGPEVLEYSDFPTPEPKPGEALLRLHAAALNRVDIFTRKGWPGLRLEMPHINGADGAGEIAALGEGVTDFHVGDHVAINANIGCGECEYCLRGQDNLCRNWHLLGETTRGTYAENIALHTRQLYRLPQDFDYHTAAAAALVYQTAWHSLLTRGGLKPGETVLVVGAGGGVNTASIEIAKFKRAQVIVVGSSAEKLKRAGELGADVLIDRSKEPDWSRAVYAATGKRGVDVVVDNVGTTFPLSMRSLAKAGRLLTVGNSGGLDTGGTVSKVAVSGTCAYVSGSSAGLVIADVSNPAVPVQLGVYDTGGACGKVAIDGRRLYVANGLAGLLIVAVGGFWFIPATRISWMVQSGRVSAIPVQAIYAQRSPTLEIQTDSGRVTTTPEHPMHLAPGEGVPFLHAHRTHEELYVVVGGRGELEFGSNQGDQSAWFIDPDHFSRLWASSVPVFALIKKDDLETLQKTLTPPLKVLGSQGRRMLITNR